MMKRERDTDAFGRSFPRSGYCPCVDMDEAEAVADADWIALKSDFKGWGVSNLMSGRNFELSPRLLISLKVLE